MTLVRLEPAAPQSRVKHSTTEPLRSLCKSVFLIRYQNRVDPDQLALSKANLDLFFPRKNQQDKGYVKVKLVSNVFLSNFQSCYTVNSEFFARIYHDN